MTNASVVSPAERTKNVVHLVKVAGWKEHTIPATPFTLKAYGSPARSKTPILKIYIEGDGLAWFSEDMPSDNPTPITPTGLQMAVRDREKYSVAYLARPCQFVFNNEWTYCRQAYWTNLRFSPEVINAMNQAVDNLKKVYHAKQIILVGYSGGGTIAALIAARRTDVMKLITVAAILDIQQWVQQENLTPLNGSLNPADRWRELASVPQTHWVGGKDTVAPKEVAFAFASHFPPAKKPEIKVVPNYDHTCCWATD